MVVWAGIENLNGKFSSESNHPATVLLDWDCRFLDRSMSSPCVVAPEMHFLPGTVIKWDSENCCYWVVNPATDIAVGKIWVDSDFNVPVYYVYRVYREHDFMLDDFVYYDGSLMYYGQDWVTAQKWALELI